ncbi:MAG: phosphate ABC transporter substrate-binding protein [Eubacteriales bacterium]
MKKILIVVLALILALAMFAACQKEEAPQATDKVDATDAPKDEVTAEPAEAPLSGEVTVSGSTSVEKIGLALGDEFMAMYPDVKYTYQGIGSSAGVKNANEGVSMLGTASRNIKDSEKEWGMTEEVLAYDGIAVIVNPANSVTSLTMEQIQKIYLGEITNWADLGGEDQEIVVVSREDGSGTRGAFEEIVEFENMLVTSALIQEGNGAVHAAVKENAAAIGYISFTYIDDQIKTVTVDGAEPTVEEVLAGSYPVSRPFMIVYHDENLSDAAKAFLEFTKTDLAKEIIEEKGGIAVD